MLKNYLKIAWRNILHNKAYTAINVAGLSLGLCACIVIYTIVYYEFSFDRFQPGHDHIYRVMANVKESTGDRLQFARIPMAVSPSARSETTGLVAVAGFIPYNAAVTVPDENKASKHFISHTDNSHYLTSVIAEPQYFDIFKYQWLAGDAATALEAPFKVVLTESKARQYFGDLSPDKVIGKQIIYDDSLIVTVSGIIRDWQNNTDLGVTDFISFSTIKSSFLNNSMHSDSWEEPFMNMWTFVKLSKGTKPGHINTQMASLVKKHAEPKTSLSLWLQPLSDIHFDADVIENPIRTADKSTLYSLTAIALFILILAIINFINLSTAQSIRRAKEVGVRKVLGGHRDDLIFQFFTETFAITLLAVIIAVVLVKPVLIGFQSYIPQGITFNFFDSSTIIFLGVITVITSLLAGFYPALILSAYVPAISLKGAGEQRSGGKWLLRKGLIVFQFSVSLVFIIGSIVITDQLKYALGKNPGFNADAIINVDTPGGDSLSKARVFAQKVKQLTGVNEVALQWVPPMTGNGRGHAIRFKRTDIKETGVTQIAGDENYIPLYQIKLLAGRNIMHADSMKEIVINQTLSRMMGCKHPGDAIGKTLYWDDKSFPVVGVVADFHSRSFHEAITPVCIVNRPDREGTLAIKLASSGNGMSSIKNTLSQIGVAWKQLYPGGTFKYQFYDESLAMLYENDQQEATLMNTSMGITIFISCFGLFGLVLFTAEKRAKEISIRKISGASVTNIATMLSRDFIVLVVIAFFIASPIAFYFMNRWLQSFAYRIHISWWIFLIAGVAAILIALITVSFQAIKAAMANPLDSLRSE